MFAALRTSFPDLVVSVNQMVMDEDKIAIAYTIAGTQEGEFLGVAPTGRKIRARGVQIARFRDGKMVERWGTQTSWESSSKSALERHRPSPHEILAAISPAEIWRPTRPRPARRKAVNEFAPKTSSLRHEVPPINHHQALVRPRIAGHRTSRSRSSTSSPTAQAAARSIFAAEISPPPPSPLPRSNAPAPALDSILPHCRWASRPQLPAAHIASSAGAAWPKASQKSGVSYETVDARAASTAQLLTSRPMVSLTTVRNRHILGV